MRRIAMGERITFRVTPADRALLEAAAATVGDRLSDFVRDHVRKAARRELVGSAREDGPSDR